MTAGGGRRAVGASASGRPAEGNGPWRAEEGANRPPPAAHRGRKRLGVIGSFVWDVIHGRDPRDLPVEEWGGITYSLSALDAALPDTWEIVPVTKVGADLAPRAREFLQTMRRLAADAAPVEVPLPTARVELRYYSEERRSEVTRGGMPGWTWLGLKPLIDSLRLDAIYVNFLSGWELDLETARLLRAHFRGPIYCDLHMLVTSVQSDGLRAPRPLPDVAAWCGCFDVLQVNEDEMAMMAPDPMALAATAMAAGVSCLVVTLGKRGAVYFAAPAFHSLADLPPRGGGGALATSPRGGTAATFGPVRTALVPAASLRDPLARGTGDPTGCGDVWGATYFSRLVAGDKLPEAMRAAHAAAALNVEHRGATGLASFLRGEIARP